MSTGNKRQHKTHEQFIAEVAEPSKWQVVLLNDDYSTMEFVIEVLTKVFKKNRYEAERIMLEVHQKGQAVCGIYCFEIAEAKVETVSVMAKDSGFPLRAALNPL